jgi:hypothetical protein
MEVAARMDPSPYMVSASRHLGLLLLQHFDEQRGADLIRRGAAIAETMKWSVEYQPALAALERVNQSQEQEKVGQAP